MPGQSIKLLKGVTLLKEFLRDFPKFQDIEAVTHPPACISA